MTVRQKRLLPPIVAREPRRGQRERGATVRGCEHASLTIEFCF